MAMDMFLELDKIKGESIDKKHKDKIDVLAWSWGATQSGTTHLQKGGGAGKVSVGDISITKWIDKSSPVLFKHVCSGQHIKTGTLIVRKAGGKKPLEYIKISMKDIMVSAVSTGGSGGEDRLTENVTLNFAAFKLEYIPQKEDGTGEAAVDCKWDMPENVEAF